MNMIYKSEKKAYKGFLVTGNTYPLRHTIKGIGGKWNKEYEAWIIPAKKDAAKSIIKLKKEKGLQIRAIKTDENVFRRMTEAERLENRMNKAERKAERWENIAAKRGKEAQNSFKASNNLVKNIPLGQPILVGHHSERGHRRTLERAQNLMFKGVELQQIGRDYEEKAESLTRHMSYIQDTNQLKGRIVKLEKELKYWENKLKNNDKEIAATTAVHKMYSNGSKESEDNFKEEVQNMRNRVTYYKQQIENKKADIESIKSLLPEEALQPVNYGVKLNQLSGASFKKLIGVKTVSKRYHNKNLSGGNFAIELRNEGMGNGFELHGLHDPDGIIISLSIGNLFSGGTYTLINKENYKEMTLENIIPTIKKFTEQLK